MKMKKEAINNSDKLPKNARKIDLNNNNNNQETLVTEISKPTTNLDDTLFPPTLEEYILEDSLGGGTGSVYKIKNINNNNRLVLKYGASRAAMETEILCNTIYKICGVPVPKSKVYTSLPQDLAAKLDISPSGIFQVSEFITEDNKNQTEKETIIGNAAKAHFLVHVLLGNTDIFTLDNFIIKNEKDFLEAVLIDVGANFLYKALGKWREENPSFATELKTFLRDPKNVLCSKWFGGLKENELREQADDIKKRMPQIAKAIFEVSKTLGISDYRRDQFIEYLADRLDKILIPYASVLPYAKIDKKAIKGETGAGVLTYRIRNNEVQVLLSRRKKDRYWSNFGGESDENEKLIDTARRKVYKESSGEINYSEYELKESPFHDFISDITYRMYIARRDEVDLRRLTDSRHTAHQWVPLRALEKSEVITVKGKTALKITTEKGPIRLYPPLYNMMKQKAISKHLENLNEKKPCKPTHTQSRHNKEDKFNDGYIPKTRELITDQIAKTSLSRSKLFFHSLWSFRHADHSWVPLSALLRALEKSEVITVKGKTALKIETEKGSILLCLPLDIMDKTAVLNHLKNSNEDKLNDVYIPIQRELISGQTPSLWSFKPKNNFDLAKASLSNATLLFFDERKISNNNNVKPINEPKIDLDNNNNHPINRKLSQSAVHLKAVLGKDYAENDTKKNVQTFLDVHYPKKYDLLWMTDETEPKRGKFYVRVSNNMLEYMVINSRGEKIIDVIKKEELKNVLSEEQYAQLVKGFHPKKLEPILSKILDIVSTRDQIHPKLSDNQRELLTKHCEALISEEINHPELFYAYHGVDNSIAFAYDVYTRLYRMIHMDERWQALRLDKGQFKAFPTINEFIAYYSKMGTINVYDLCEGYSDVTISANAFLFGNRLEDFCNSIYFLLNNATSRETCLELIFKNFLQPFNVGEYEIKQLMSLFERYASNKGGSLYQISMSPEEVAKYTYPAGTYGVMNPFEKEKNLTKIMTKLKEEIIKPNLRTETIRYIEHLEIRVMTSPSRPLKMNQINLEGEKDPEIEKQYEMELNKAVESVLYQMLKNINSFNKPDQEALFGPFHEEMKKNHQNPDSFAQMPKETLMRAIIHNDMVVIKSILKHFPELLWEKLSIASDHVESSIIQISRGMKTIEMLIEHSSNFGVILSDAHGENWFEQIKDDCSFRVIKKVLESIPDKYRFDFANKHQNKIEGITLGCVVGKLPENTRYKFAKLHAHLIKNSFNLVDVLSKLPVGDRYTFAEENSNSITDLSLVLDLLPPGEACYQFAKAHQDKIQNGHALAAVLKILSKNIGTLSENSVYEFALENQDKINNGQELIAVLEVLKKGNRYNIATTKKDKIEYFQGVCSVLGMLSEETQYKFAQENKDRVKNAMHLSFMLAKFSSKTDQYTFAEENKDKIKNDKDLNYVCNQLPVERRDEFKKKIMSMKLMQAIIHNDAVEIKFILKHFPELLWEKLSIASDHVDNDDSLNIWQGVKAIEMLIEHSSNFGVILSDAHGEKWFEQIKDDCSFHLIEKVLENIPDKYRFDFANKHQNKIEGSTLGYVVGKLPENTRYKFAKLHAHLIKNSRDLRYVLSKLPVEDRYTFAEENSNSIEDGLSLYKVLDLLPPGEACYQFAKAHQDKIQNGHALAAILKILSKNIGTLSENSVYEFALENQDKINNGQELIAVLEELKKGNRYNIATTKKDKIEHFQGVCSVLGMLSEEIQYKFAQENKDRIKNAMHLSFMLAKFSSKTDQYTFAEENKNKIHNDMDLKYVCNQLPVERRDEFKKMINLNHNDEEVSFKLGK